MLLLLSVELRFRGLPAIGAVVVDGEQCVSRLTPLVTHIPVSGKLADVFAGGVGHRDLDLVVVVQSPSGVLRQPLRGGGAQGGGGALSAPVAVHGVLLV